MLVSILFFHNYLVNYRYQAINREDSFESNSQTITIKEKDIGNLRLHIYLQNQYPIIHVIQYNLYKTIQKLHLHFNNKLYEMYKYSHDPFVFIP